MVIVPFYYAQGVWYWAAVVIVGAMFKSFFTGSSIMLGVGLTVEAVIFS